MSTITEIHADFQYNRITQDPIVTQVSAVESQVRNALETIDLVVAISGIDIIA